MQSGITTVSLTDEAANSVTYTYSTGTITLGIGNHEFNSLDDLVSEISDDFDGGGFGTLSASVTAAGALRLTNLDGGATEAVTVASNNSSLNTAFTDLSATIGIAGTVDSDEFSHTAEGGDDLVDLRNSTGTSLGLTVG